MKDFNVDLNTNKWVFLYYLILYLICLSWTNLNMVEPPLVARLLVTSAVFLPLIKYFWLLPSVLILFIGIRFNSIAPFGYLPQSWNFYCFSTIMLGFLHQAIYGEKILNFTIKQWLLLIFLALLQTYDLKYFFEIIPFAITLFIAYKALNSRVALNVSIFSFILLAFSLSIYFFLFADEFIKRTLFNELERATWVDPNYFGHLIGIGVVIAFFYLVQSSDNKFSYIYKLIFMFCSVAAFSVVVMQASRGAVISVSIAILAVILYSNTKLIYKILSVCFIVFVVVYLFKNGAFEIIMTRISEEDSSGSGRLSIWMEKLSFLNDNLIFLVGTGFKGSVYSFPPYELDCHNEFISILLNYGIVGACILFFESARIMFFNKNTLAKVLLIYIYAAFMTISPLSCITGWTGIPVLLPILFRLNYKYKE